jgi:hypothetical protein
MVLFLLFTALSALTTIKMVVIIPARCIAKAKLLGDLLPALRKLLQRRQIKWQRLLANAVPMLLAFAL